VILGAAGGVDHDQAAGEAEKEGVAFCGLPKLCVGLVPPKL
jgi:hypothetical protein